MKITLRDSEYNTKDIELIEDNKKLTILFGGNGDLYWIFNNKDCSCFEEIHTDTFTITKENYKLYELFNILYDDIEKLRVFDRDEIPYYVESREDYINWLNEKELEKKRCIMFGYSNYNTLFDENNKTITWYSDETNRLVSNYVKIIKKEETFELVFGTQEYIDGYEREDNFLGTIGVRFRNSGSSYDPFNVSFMKMFQELEKIDDVLDEGHQVHIEEYLYNEGLVKKLVLNKK